MFSVRSLINDQGPFDAIYAFGTDLVLMAQINAPGTSLIVEIGDVREVLVSDGVAAKVIQWLDSRIVRSANGVAVTSAKFVSEYYQGREALPGKC